MTMAEELADLQNTENAAALEPDAQIGQVEVAEKPDKIETPEKPEKLSIREGLKRAFAEDEKRQRDPKSGQFTKKDTVEAPSAPVETPKAEKDEQPKAASMPAVGPPPGWS